MIFPIHKSQMNPDSIFFEKRMENIERAEDAYKNGSETSSDLPLRLNFQTNYTCNARCIICPYRRPLKNAPVMDVSVFDNVAEETFPYLSEISTTDIGEPLMLPWLGHLCKKLNEYDVIADIVTNGTLINESLAHDILSCAYDIKISYDAFTSDLFESIRTGCPQTEVVRGLTTLIKNREKEKPPQQPTITIQTSLLKRNIHQLPDIVRFASDIGADRVKAYYAFSYSEKTDAEVLAGDDSEYTHYVEEAREFASENGLKMEVAEASDDESVTKRVKCTTAWYQSWIDYDGTLYPCHSHGGYSIGNVSESVRKIWNSDKYREIRKASITNSPDTPCYLCGMLYSQAGSRNRAPYDSENFLSQNSRDRKGNGIKWSNRSRLFDRTL